MNLDRIERYKLYDNKTGQFQLKLNLDRIERGLDIEHEIIEKELKLNLDRIESSDRDTGDSDIQ